MREDSRFDLTVYTTILFLGLYNDSAEWSWTYVGLIGGHRMFAATRARRSFGADVVIVRRTASRYVCTEPLAHIWNGCVEARRFYLAYPPHRRDAGAGPAQLHPDTLDRSGES